MGSQCVCDSDEVSVDIPGSAADWDEKLSAGFAKPQLRDQNCLVAQDLELTSGAASDTKKAAALGNAATSRA